MRTPSRALLAAAAVAFASPVLAAGNSLSDDYSRMMRWLSDEMVDPLAFNAGTTFDPPNELTAFEPSLDLSFGVGILPLDIAKFPTLSNKTLNDRNVSASFPQRVPFPDLTAHVRLGLPGRWDAAARLSNTTAPTINMTPETKAGGQANNVGVSFRRFFFGTQGRPKLAIGLNANYLWGKFTFSSRYEDVAMSTLTTDADNEGWMKWSLKSVGLNATVSKKYGPWTPYGGVGFNIADGTHEARLYTDFTTYLALPSEGRETSRPQDSNVRLLFGTQLERRSGRDLFLSGEVLASGGEGHSFNVHLGMIIPLRFGAARERIEKRAVPISDDLRDAPRSLREKEQHLIFIR